MENGSKKRRVGGQPRNVNALVHGFHTVHSAVKQARQRLLSRRTQLGRAVAEWRADVVRDLGGKENLSTLQLDTLDRLLTTKLLLDTVDAIVATLPSPVNRRSRVLHPVILQRNGLVETERKLRADLGLERRARAIPSLSDYLRGKAQIPEPRPASLCAESEVSTDAPPPAASPTTEDENVSRATTN